MRSAYAANPDYDPFAGAGPAQAAIVAALERGDAKTAANLAEQSLRRDFMDVRTQMLASSAEQQLGAKARAAVHDRVAKAMLRAIAATGDGASEPTAYHVLAASEEAALVTNATMRWHGQVRVASGGHWYDVVTLRHLPDKSTSQVYFNVDAPFRRATYLAQAAAAGKQPPK